MSAKNPFLKYCRYFKGESENPYESKDRNKAMLWFYEMGWAKNAERDMSPVSSDVINEYKRCGLEQFGDGVPLSLRALLFNRFAKTEQSLMDAVEPFKNFYKKYY